MQVAFKIVISHIFLCFLVFSRSTIFRKKYLKNSYFFFFFFLNKLLFTRTNGKLCTNILIKHPEIYSVICNFSAVTYHFTSKHQKITALIS